MKKKQLVAITILIMALALIITGCGPKSYTVSGKVTGVNGEPLAGVQIVANGKVNMETTTNDKGEWTLPRLKGSTTIQAYMANRAFKPAKQVVTAVQENVNFAAQFPLVITIEGKGTVSFRTGSGTLTTAPSEEGYALGETVTLTAEPLPGWGFSYWSGDWNGARSSFSIPMDGPKKITVKFEQGPSVIVFEDPDLEAVVRKAINKPIGSITREDVENLTHLNASVTSIQSLKGIENLLGLSWLDLSVTNTTAINELASLTKLGYLNLDSNQIVDINALGKLVQLSELRLNNNKITDITSLTWLANKNFVKADLGNNQITNVTALKNLLTLQALNLGNNQIADITPLKALTEMRELDLSANLIDKLDAVTGMRKLEKLNMRKNKLANVDQIVWLKDSNMTDLNLSENLIVDITKLGQLSKLVKLNLANNKIIKISALASLTNLQELNLSGNQIVDISSLATLKSVEKLFLHKNAITDIQPLLAMPSLKEVTLMDNQLNLSTGQPAYNVIKELRNRNVLVRYDYYQNDAPIIKYPDVDTMTINEAQELKFTVVAIDPNRDEMTYEATGELKEYFDPVSHVFAWTPSYTDAGVHDVTFVVKDSETTTTKKLTITVNNLNRAPVFTPAIGNKTVDETKTLTFKINAVDPDGDNVAYSVDDSPLKQYFDMQTLTFTWTPTYEEAGVYQMTFRTTDGDKESAETITITVNNVNRPPILHPISNKTVDEDQLLEFTISGEDPDKEDTLVYSAEGPFSDKFDPESRKFSWRPGYDQAGTYVITFQVSDGRLSATQAVTITVNNVDRAPVFDPIEEKRIDEFSVLRFTVHAVDPDGDIITYSASNMPAKATLNATTGEFTWMPVRSDIGERTITFIATSKLKTASISVKIIINDIPFKPELNPIGNKIVNEGQTLQFKVDGLDKDGDIVTYRATSPSFLAQFFNPSTQMFEWTPGYNVSQGADMTFPITFYISDGMDEVSETITITVKNTNQKPEVLVDANQYSVKEGEEIQFKVSTRDGDGDPVDLNPMGDKKVTDHFDSATGNFYWMTDYTSSGDYTLSLFATDGKDITRYDIKIHVENVDRMPTIQAIPNNPRDLYEYDTITFALMGSDPDNDPLTYSAENLPTGATLNQQTGTFSWKPDYTHVGKEFTIIFYVHANGQSASTPLTIRVLNKSFAPEFTSPTQTSYAVKEGEPVTYQVEAFDKDNDPLTYSIEFPNDPKYTPEVKDMLSNAFNVNTHIFQWTPGPDVATNTTGPVSYTMTFKVTDGNSPQIPTKDITITINNVDRLPKFFINSLQQIMVKDSGDQSFTISVSDADKEPVILSIKAESKPLTARFDIVNNGTSNPTGTFTWSPTAADVGDHLITFTASAGGQVVTETVMVTVQGSKLLVTNLSIEDGSLKPGESSGVHATIVNNGNVTTNPFNANWEVIGKNQAGAWVTYRFNTTTGIGPLGSGGSVVIDAVLSADVLLTAGIFYGDCTLRILADPSAMQGGPASKEIPFKLAKPEYTLTVNVNGIAGNTVLKSPDQTLYEEGTEVTLTAKPREGWRFIGWTGDLNSPEKVAKVIVNANMVIQANFEQITLPRPIAFVAKRQSTGELYIMDQNGATRQVTNTNLEVGAVRWSPNGEKILFEAKDKTTGRQDIYLYDLISDSLRNMTGIFSSAKVNKSPAWHPNGDKFAYATNEAGTNFEIYVHNIDGSLFPARRVTFTGTNNDHPIWSPDGTQLVCVSSNAGDSYGSLMMMKLINNATDWSGISLNKDSTVAPRGANPSWSPDGSKILFDYDQDIFQVEFDTGGSYASWTIKRITNNRSNRKPVWAPDGSRFTYESNVFGSYDIFTLGVGDPVELASRLTFMNTANESDARWSPDLSKLVFVSDQDGDNEIYMIDPDGSNQVQLTNNNVSDFGPRWKP